MTAEPARAQADDDVLGPSLHRHPSGVGVVDKSVAILDALESETRQLAGRAPRSLAAAAEEAIEERVVVGTTAEVVDRLGTLRERLGIDLLIVRPQVPLLGGAAREDALARLVEEVWPALR